MNLVHGAVAELAQLSSSEAGCLRYDVHRSVKMPSRLIIHEIWGSKEALRQHRESDHVAQFKDSIIHTAATVWASVFHPFH